MSAEIRHRTLETTLIKLNNAALDPKQHGTPTRLPQDVRENGSDVKNGLIGAQRSREMEKCISGGAKHRPLMTKQEKQKAEIGVGLFSPPSGLSGVSGQTDPRGSLDSKRDNQKLGLSPTASEGEFEQILFVNDLHGLSKAGRPRSQSPSIYLTEEEYAAPGHGGLPEKHDFLGNFELRPRKQERGGAF